MQVFAGGQAFDGGDLATVLHDGQRQARVDPFAVHQHSAGAALALVAALLGAGHACALAQQVKQRYPRFDVEFAVLAVDAQSHRMLLLMFHVLPLCEKV